VHLFSHSHAQPQLDEISAFQPNTAHTTLTRAGSDANDHMLWKQHQSIINKDNVGALEIATQGSQYRSRTKHISLKGHHFHDHVSSGEIIVQKIHMSVQWADFLTKPLTCVPFECLHKLVMGVGNILFMLIWFTPRCPAVSLALLTKSSPPFFKHKGDLFLCPQAPGSQSHL
jgi:hypothetical protein